MSLWSSIASKLKEMIKKMFSGNTIGTALNLQIAPVISLQMEEAIKLWDDMYKGKADWLHEPTDADPTRVVSLGLPSLIASEKARTALIEFNSEITTPTKEVEKPNPNYKEPEPDEYGNMIPTAEPPTIIEDVPTSNEERAQYLEEQYKKLKRQLRKQIEYGIAKGGLVIKPYVVVNKSKDDKGKQVIDYDIEFDFIQADAFYPLAFDASGHITEAAFVQTKVDKSTIYRRLEYHKWNNNTVTVINKAFKTNNIQMAYDMDAGGLGNPCPLTDIPEWSGLQETVTIKGVDRPLFAYFKMPEANTIDTNSPLGVSGYSRATNLIKDADLQYSRFLWEYEAGEMAIDIDRDALRSQVGADGLTHETLSHGQQRLFRKVDLGQTGDTYNVFAPALRDTSYSQGLNAILMRIEDVCAMSRGTLSDATQEARTATELKILKQRSYQSNADIQQSLEDTLKDVVYIMDTYCTLYEITKPGEYDVSFEWDDSIIVDVDTELGKRMTLLQNGLMSKVELRMWYFGETERQAQEALQNIEGENLDDMEKELSMESAFGQPNFSQKQIPKKEEVE